MQLSYEQEYKGKMENVTYGRYVNMITIFNHSQYYNPKKFHSLLEEGDEIWLN